MIAAGLQGRPSDIEKPTIDVEESYVSRTSVFFLDGQVSDNFGVSRLTINKTPIKLDETGKFSHLVSLMSSPQIANILIEDEAGNTTQKNVEIHRSERLEGSIAQIVGNKVFINLGSNANLREGTGFTVSSIQQIKDPVTGQILDSLSLDVAIIRVIEVKEKIKRR